MTDDDGDTTLQKAVRNQHLDVVKLLVKEEDPEFILQATLAGETPLHLTAESGFQCALLEILESCTRPSYAGPCGRTAPCINNSWICRCYVPELIDHPREMKMAFNKENQTPQDATLAYSWSRDRDRIECHLLRVGRMGRHDFKIGLQNKEKPKDEVETGDQTQQQEQKTEKKSKKMIDKVVKAAQTHLIVATLVVTVTFAAGFTLPGGFDSNPSPNQGMAILTRKAAFKAFIITDAIGFVCSAGAVFSYFAMVANAAFFQEVRAVRRLYMIATGLQLLALAAVVLAFVTGIYATLVHAIGLAITVSSIGCISFLIYFYMLFMTFDWKSL
ncbi:hypothetical protein K7X08_002739 [Anisodus acutangulus]|uniref:PGG domain-containing protein n=1 Tax=Anisodus acutangulus TaxID=402998 RepID=A0A9Q1RHK7_9SOLA|nr:hypothetical protein K7X08_002739 [Anisodus acutangulus]